MSRRLSPGERVLGLALTAALRPSWEEHAAAVAIAAKAPGPAAVRSALARVSAVRRERPSLVTLRAHYALTGALMMLEHRAA